MCRTRPHAAAAGAAAPTPAAVQQQGWTGTRRGRLEGPAAAARPAPPPPCSARSPECSTPNDHTNHTAAAMQQHLTAMIQAGPLAPRAGRAAEQAGPGRAGCSARSLPPSPASNVASCDVAVLGGAPAMAAVQQMQGTRRWPGQDAGRLGSCQGGVCSLAPPRPPPNTHSQKPWQRCARTQAHRRLQLRRASHRLVSRSSGAP
jgi:hypothetical protein